MTVRRIAVYWGLSALVAVLLFLFLYPMTMLFPEADDFDRANIANGLFDFSGGVANLRDTWMNSSGRFTHHFLVVFLGDAILSSLTYAMVCLTLQGITFAALYGIFVTISRSGCRSLSLFLALFSLLALQCGHTAYDFTYTLQTDVLGIGIGNSLVLVYIFVLTRFWFCTPERVALLTGLSVLVAFIAAGCYEHAAMCVGAASVVLMVLALLYKHPYRLACGLILAGSVVALCATMLAPGNLGRNPTLFHAFPGMKLAIEEWLQFGFGMFSPVYVVLALTLAALLPPRWRTGLDARYGWAPVFGVGIACIVLFAFVLCLMHVVSGYKLVWASKLPASIALLGAYGLVFLTLAMRDTLQKVLGHMPFLLVPVVGILVLCASPNMQRILSDVLGGNVANYVMQQRQIFATFEKRNGGDMVIDRLEYVPFPMWSFREFDVSFEKTDIWPNSSIAGLYGYKSVSRQFVSANYAYDEIKHKLPLTATSPLPSALPPSVNECAVLLNIRGNIGENSGRDWLLIRSTIPLATLHTVVIEDAGKHRLLPKFLQRVLAAPYLDRDTAFFSLPIQMAGLSRTFDASHWQVTSAPGYLYMLPLRAASSRGIQAVFAGWDSMWRIPLRQVSRPISN